MLRCERLPSSKRNLRHRSFRSLSAQCFLRTCLLEEGKVRIIDDLKASGVNQEFSSSSYLALQDIDYTVALLRFVARTLQGDGSVKVPLRDGSVLERRLCPEMCAKPPLLGKTLDLSKAYRQVAVRPD